jgi:hypothetical protein
MIQRPMGQGSILGAMAVGVATLFAVGALAWGAVNATATKHAATPVAAPTYLEKGSRGDALIPGLRAQSPATATPVQPDKGIRDVGMLFSDGSPTTQVERSIRYFGGGADTLGAAPVTHPRRIPNR